MNKSKTNFDDVLEQLPGDIYRFIDKSDDLIIRIQNLLKQKGLTQNDLAVLMNKHKSEVSKMLKVGHNITLKTICKIEYVLDAELINVSKEESNHKRLPIQMTKQKGKKAIS